MRREWRSCPEEAYDRPWSWPLPMTPSKPSRATIELDWFASFPFTKQSRQTCRIIPPEIVPIQAISSNRGKISVDILEIGLELGNLSKFQETTRSRDVRTQVQNFSTEIFESRHRGSIWEARTRPVWVLSVAQLWQSLGALGVNFWPPWYHSLRRGIRETRRIPRISLEVWRSP